MKQRCQNPADAGYNRYGARGIKVCKEWRSFEVFNTWAMENGYKEGHSHDTDHIPTPEYSAVAVVGE